MVVSYIFVALEINKIYCILYIQYLNTPRVCFSTSSMVIDCVG